MGRNIFDGNPAYGEALTLAKSAKAERDKANEILKGAKAIEDQAVEKFRQLRTSKFEELKAKEKELVEQYEDMRKKYHEMFYEFCKIGKCHHNTRRTVITSYREIGHSFGRGSIYPTETYCTCQICGNSNDPAQFRGGRYRIYTPTKEGMEVVKKAAESDENPEVKEFAQKILAYPAEMEKVENLIKEVRQNLEELCKLFGHDAKLVSYDHETYECKCCGKHLTYQEYINAHYAATFRGGIVPFNYSDESPIM